MTPEQCAAWLRALAADWRQASLSSEDRALCEFAEKLTRAPWAMCEADVVGLRQAGFDDVSIHDAIQVVSYFNYINRFADAVDVELEPDMEPDPRRK
jgi:uncharacterized peroxidase-related enzyme